MNSRSRCSSSLGLLLVLFLALLPPGRANAQPAEPADTDARYREAFVEGTRLFAEHEWAKARTAFQRAYALRPVPLLLFNIGSTYRRQGDNTKAIQYYRRYLQEASPDAELRGLAEKTIVELSEPPAADPAPPPTVDRRPAAVEPRPPSPEQSPPAVEPFADSPGRDPSHRLDAATRPGRGLRITGSLLATAGIGLFGWSGLELYRSRAAADDLRSLPEGTPWSESHQARWDQGERSERRAFWLGIAGGGALVTGAIIYWIGHRRGRAATLTVVPNLADGPGAAVVGTF